MINIRTKFRRSDEVKYISHLDLMKVFERAIRRARLPIAYSQGFNPHPGMVFGLPLGVGVTSDAEYADFEITDEGISISKFISALNAQLPNGLEVLSAKVRSSKQNIMSIIAASEYTTIIGTRSDCTDKNFKQSIHRYLAQKEIIVKKRTKNGIKDTNIRDMIYDLNYEIQPFGVFNIIKLTMLVSAGSKANLKPDLLIESLCGFLDINFEIDRVHRTKLFVQAQDQLLDPMDVLVL